MCCCIPLRRLSYFGAAFHMMVGLLYFYFMGSVGYSIYRIRDKERHEERLKLGLLYIGYYAAFLPPGIFIFWGVHKKLRCFLAVPSILFLCIQIYGVTLEGIYKFRPHWLPEVMEKYNEPSKIPALQADYWMDMSIQMTVTLVYVFMLFFYYREISPDDSPVRSRYAQAYLQQMQQQQQSPPNTVITQPTSRGPPPVPFRPASHPHSHSQPHSLVASTTNLSNSTGFPMNFGALNLTYEQQQQLLKLQQHPLILEQLQLEGQGRGHHQHQHLLQQHMQEEPPDQSMFHPYQLVGAEKTPKF